MNALKEIWREAWQPPDRRPAWQWCEDHIEAIPYSPNPGRFRSDNSPWIREVMESLVDPRIRLVSIIASVQSSKTTAPELTLCYIISNLPGPALWLDQTDEDARDYSESRLQKLFDQCQPVARLMPTGVHRHKRKNNAIQFNNGMTLWILGAHNKTNLQRRSIRWLIGDETWRWPQGHMAEAEARVTAFGWLGKCIFMSQGGEEDDDTHRKFEMTDQREWTFACPECHHRQPFKWECVEWSKSARDESGEWDFDEVRRTTAMRCESCNHYFNDGERTRRELNATGAFVAKNPKASKENVGFHWNALCAMSWGQLAELYLRAKAAARKGDVSLLQQFYQKRLGLPWREYVEDYKLEIVKSGYKRGETWEEEGAIDPKTGKVLAAPLPERTGLIPLRFITVDCQMDHLFVVVRSWSAEGSSRLMWNERILTFTDIDDDYLAQLESEQRIKEKGQWMWKQIGSRPNHYFDCEAEQAAAATMLKELVVVIGDLLDDGKPNKSFKIGLFCFAVAVLTVPFLSSCTTLPGVTGEFISYFARERKGVKNSPPPKRLWKNIVPALRVVDELRASFGKPCRILSSYRAPAYNKAVGGAPLSQHLEFTALDIAFDGISPQRVYDRLIEWRKAGKFIGGLGLYHSSGFVHIDTRGRNATWKGS